MDKLPHPSDTVSPPEPRRLKFSTPDPNPVADQQNASLAKRKKKPERFKHAPNNRARLPDGAHFDVRFDAEKVMWSGWLEVGLVRVEAKAGSVMTLLSVLDEKFRADPRAPKVPEMTP